MNWILIAVAFALFVTWIVLRVDVGFPLDLLNMLWIYAILLLLVSAAQKMA